MSCRWSARLLFGRVGPEEPGKNNIWLKVVFTNHNDGVILKKGKLVGEFPHEKNVHVLVNRSNTVGAYGDTFQVQIHYVLPDQLEISLTVG